MDDRERVRVSDYTRFQSTGQRRRSLLRMFDDVPTAFVDVDGTLTDGRLYVDVDGDKPFKAFGLDDHAAIARWKELFPVVLITSDWQPSATERAIHMKVPILHVAATADERIAAIRREKRTEGGVVYIGDGYHDADVMEAVEFGIAPADAWPETLRRADAVTSRDGGRRAVAQALDFIGEQLIREDVLQAAKEKVTR